jgi:hypothetical protein
MNLEQALGAALNKLIALNPATLTNESGTSITVFKSFLKNKARTMNEFGYDDSFDDLYLLAKPDDVSSWTLEPMKTRILLDGVVYYLGKTTTETPGYVSIWLRKRI